MKLDPVLASPLIFMYLYVSMKELYYISNFEGNCDSTGEGRWLE